MAIKFTGISQLTGVGSMTFSSEIRDIVFSSLTNWEETDHGLYVPPTGTTGEGKSSLSLPASTDGRIICDIDDNTFDQVVLCFSTNNALSSPYFSNAEWGVYRESNYKTHDSGGFHDTGIAGSDGNPISLRRTGNTIYADYWNGSAWVNVYTLAGTSSAQLYIYVSAGADNKKLKNPYGINIT